MKSKIWTVLAVAAIVAVIGLWNAPVNALPTPPTNPPPIPASACSTIASTLSQAGVSASLVTQILAQLNCS